MRKPSPFTLLLLWLLIVLLPGYSRADNDAVANERPPLTGDQLAQHWRLNCPEIAATAQGWAERELQQQRPNWAALNWRGLELCGVIYNVRDSGRYQPCPNYGEAQAALRASRYGSNRIEPATTADYLTNCKRRTVNKGQ